MAQQESQAVSSPAKYSMNRAIMMFSSAKDRYRPDEPSLGFGAGSAKSIVCIGAIWPGYQAGRAGGAQMIQRAFGNFAIGQQISAGQRQHVGDAAHGQVHPDIGAVGGGEIALGDAVEGPGLVVTVYLPLA